MNSLVQIGAKFVTATFLITNMPNVVKYLMRESTTYVSRCRYILTKKKEERFHHPLAEQQILVVLAAMALTVDKHYPVWRQPVVQIKRRTHNPQWTEAGLKYF
jgi:hypothetical protein